MSTEINFIGFLVIRKKAKKKYEIVFYGHNSSGVERNLIEIKLDEINKFKLIISDDKSIEINFKGNTLKYKLVNIYELFKLLGEKDYKMFRAIIEYEIMKFINKLRISPKLVIFLERFDKVIKINSIYGTLWCLSIVFL